MEVAERVGQSVLLSVTGQATTGHALEAQVLGGAVATLGVVPATVALMPLVGGVGDLAGEALVTGAGEVATDVDDLAVSVDGCRPGAVRSGACGVLGGDARQVFSQHHLVRRRS